MVTTPTTPAVLAGVTKAPATVPAPALAPAKQAPPVQPTVQAAGSTVAAYTNRFGTRQAPATLYRQLRQAKGHSMASLGNLLGVTRQVRGMYASTLHGPQLAAVLARVAALPNGKGNPGGALP